MTGQSASAARGPRRAGSYQLPLRSGRSGPYVVQTSDTMPTSARGGISPEAGAEPAEPSGCTTGFEPATPLTGTRATTWRLMPAGFVHSSETRIRTSTTGFRARHPAVRTSRNAGSRGSRFAGRSRPLPTSRVTVFTDDLRSVRACRIYSVPYLPRAAGLPLRSILVFRGNRLRRDCS